MYNAKVLPVMIASPSDVEDERQLVRDIVYQWNYTDSFHSGLVLLPIGWDTHASPDMGVPAQEQINERIVDRSDILVGIFWTRLGSPTKNEISGTVEEIKRHIDSGKPAIIYFCTKPVAPDALDQEQWSLLVQFKEWCKSQGLFDSFSTSGELERKFTRHLRHTLHENTHVKEIIARFEAISEEVEAGLKTVSFPEEAVQLLKGAVDGNGIVGKRDNLGGSSYFGGDFQIKTDGVGREDARWRAAVEKLSDYSLIEERSLGSGVFFVTHEGYEAIERNSVK
ncbi:DUF4062 domain-containing protein [uncultured Aliiroseovarius sp.]|uniref:DUF4062 domain-containing protein n=1 Tax=uncultured Aliiroseovarius sp. TaxID=1658783 RepID=UPI002611979E|nr:DUF4062 domain-containing protein [uncultured Aliiroseovarius sp.]